MVTEDHEVFAAVERILDSEVLRTAEMLRRLLRFLAEKSVSGEADQLKEYIIGIDCFGKPPEYDPRRDSTVRFQVGRLRQKLAEYYRTEGKDEPIIIDLPRGHFRLSWEARPLAEIVSLQDVQKPSGYAPATETSTNLRYWTTALGVALLLAICWGGYATFELSRKSEAQAVALWTPELDQLWQHFIQPARPVVVSIGSPMFIALGTNRTYRDGSLNQWEEAAVSPTLPAVRKAVGNPETRPSYYFTTIGESEAAFLLGKLLSTKVQRLSLTRSSQLSLQDLSDEHVVMVGSPVEFEALLKGLMTRQAFMLEKSGVRNLNPREGEPAVFADRVATGLPHEGDCYALISNLANPVGNGEVLSFISNHPLARAAAVRWFTDPVLGKTLVTKLRDKAGMLPRHYQILLKVSFRDSGPFQTSYVTSRDLSLSTHP
jgi:hypothetical protein